VPTLTGASLGNVAGAGIDAVELDRFRQSLSRTPGLLERLFSPAERDYAFEMIDPTERLAARFAAKEAVMKAMGVGLWTFKLRDVEVARRSNGSPFLVLHGKAAELARTLGICDWVLSITHTDLTAYALAVALRVPDAPSP
jgi:holo-[acyl-carrier protein] synthase